MDTKAESDMRRSTAAQFFLDDDAAAAVDNISTYDRVVELLNQASLLQKDSPKVNILKQVQELIVYKEANLLDNFLDEMLAFQSDKGTDVKKFIISFMEEACKKDYDLLPKIVPNLNLLLHDDSIVLQKRAMLAVPQMFKSVLQWIIKAKKVTDEMRQIWEGLNQMKNGIVDMLDSDNDGIRTHSIKSMEVLILCLSKKTEESELPKKPDNAFSLDQIPAEQKFLRVKKLEDEGKKFVEGLLQYQASAHISSINLMTVMSSLTTIAKQRPVFFARVLQAFEGLHVNLPPTLAKSQVSSVRKNLKMQMLALLKHPSSFEYIPQITTLLTDLGATQNEVMKSMPKIDENRKRKGDDTGQPTKKVKQELDADEDAYVMTPWVDRSDKEPKKPVVTISKQQTAIDITAGDIKDKLTPENVSDLVLVSMVMLPESMPAHFQATYTPIAAAGTDAQVKHLSRLLATQLTMAGMGRGVIEAEDLTEIETDGGTSPAIDYDGGTSPKQLIQTLVGGHTAQEDFKKSEISMLPIPQQAPVRKGMRQFRLHNVTQVFDRDESDHMIVSAYTRIINSERVAVLGNAVQDRTKILSSLVAQIGGPLKNVIQEYIFHDLRTHADLAFAWLYEEYANGQGFNSMATNKKITLASYDECLTRMLNELLDAPIDSKECLFSRLLLEAPSITDNAIEILKRYCQDVERVSIGMSTLLELIMKRPSQRLRFLNVMLEFSSHERLEIRTAAIEFIKKLYDGNKLRQGIEGYAVLHLQYLLMPNPPQTLIASVKSRELPGKWTDETIKMSLYLYLGLLPVNHKLIHELAQVYTATSADIKRVILRMLETPVKGIGMQSPELLLFVENCPRGAETLVTRVIHILTEKAAPSQDLVDRVRDLYHKRVPDVRFIIPVLTGFPKREVVAALPKLIKLNPIVVKEVFNRLLKGHGDSYVSPLSPSELLVALHNIDPVKCDMKTVIKATNFCFQERSVYTEEILAVVMQHLMDQQVLPTLLMRTVIQSLSMYPRLIGFVLNILQRLVQKEVWTQKKVWEGFVRCCLRTKPRSYPILLQLPAEHLRNVFEICPELRQPMLLDIQSYTEHQKAHIPQQIMQILMMTAEEIQIQQKARQDAEAARLEQVQVEQRLIEYERNQLEAEHQAMTVLNIDTALVKVKIEPLSDTEDDPTDSHMNDSRGDLEVLSVTVKEEKMEMSDTRSTRGDDSVGSQDERGSSGHEANDESPRTRGRGPGRPRGRSKSKRRS